MSFNWKSQPVSEVIAAFKRGFEPLSHCEFGGQQNKALGSVGSFTEIHSYLFLHKILILKGAVHMGNFFCTFLI